MSRELGEVTGGGVGGVRWTSRRGRGDFEEEEEEKKNRGDESDGGTLTATNRGEGWPISE